jgi:hypothetical protein
LTGNSLFCAVAHQLYGDHGHHALIRQACCDHMAINAERYSSFVASEDFEVYLNAMRCDKAYADQPELVYFININMTVN